MKKVTLAMMTILSVAFFSTLLKFMQGDNVQVENTKSGGGGEGGFTMA